MLEPLEQLDGARSREETGITGEVSGSLRVKKIWITLGELFIIHSDTNGNFTTGIAESSIQQFK